MVDYKLKEIEEKIDTLTTLVREVKLKQARQDQRNLLITSYLFKIAKKLDIDLKGGISNGNKSDFRSRGD